MAAYDVTLIFSTLVFAAVGFAYLRSGRATIYNPASVYLAFHGFIFVLRPILARVYDYRSIYAAVGFAPSLETKITTILATNLGLVVFVAVSLWIAPRFEFRQDPGEDAARGRMGLRVLPLFIVLGALSVWSLTWSWQFAATGERLTELDPRTGSQAMVATSGYFLSLAGFMVGVGPVFAYLNRFRWWSFLPFALFGVLAMGIGSRGLFITSCFVLGLLMLYDRRRLWPAVWMVAAVVPVYLVFSAVVVDRGAALREALGTRNEATRIFTYSGPELAPLEQMDFGNLEFFEYVVHVVPERAGTYDYFLHNLQLFTEPIPRSLWKDKPYGPPVMPVDLYRYGDPIGMTMSLPGVGWYGWGYIGVMLWTGFFALIYGWGYRAFATSRQGVTATAAYALFLGTSVVAYRDGIVLTILKQYLFYATPVVALWLTDRVLRHRDPDNPLPVEATPADSGRYSTPRARRAALAGRDLDSSA